MTSAGPPRTGRPDARAAALVARFERAGYARVEPAILQPSEPFLDLSGEDIRKRMYLTIDPQGRELCLRPDLTIPVSRDYLASRAAGKPAGFCYLGPVFRHRDKRAGRSYKRASARSFGRADIAAANAEMLALGISDHYTSRRPKFASAMSGCFRRSSPRSTWRRPGSGAW
jgi:ATP phosphoribosyltransferase regulatory subunit